MNELQTIHLCQPDEQKGCSACCGLFNHNRIEKEALDKYLAANTRIFKNTPLADIDNEPPVSSVRDNTSHICPYQGFIAPGKPGCLIHPAVNGKDYRDRSLFGKKICDNFLCPAYTLLSHRQKMDLVNYVNDWYLYTVAIIDPESFVWIHNQIADCIELTDENCELIRICMLQSLELHAQHLRRYEGPVFFYSLSEYNTGKINFSLTAETQKAQKERKETQQSINKYISGKMKNKMKK